MSEAAVTNWGNEAGTGRKMKGMVMRVQRRGDEYCVVIPQQALEALRLSEGAEVEVRPVETATARVEYVTVEEALESYRRTEPQHRKAYLELAK
jgi:antitoxin component of MazEF toxin-antitoxin module